MIVRRGAVRTRVLCHAWDEQRPEHRRCPTWRLRDVRPEVVTEVRELIPVRAVGRRDLEVDDASVVVRRFGRGSRARRRPDDCRGRREDGKGCCDAFAHRFLLDWRCCAACAAGCTSEPKPLHRTGDPA